MEFYKIANLFLENLREEEDWVLIIKLYNVFSLRKNNYFKFMPVSKMSEEEKKLLESLKDNVYTIRSDSKYPIKMYDNVIGDDKGGHKLVLRTGNRLELMKFLNQYKKQYNLRDKTFYGKPETKKHFGDILDSINENVEDNEKYVLIFKFYKNSKKQNPFKILKLKELSQQYKDILGKYNPFRDDNNVKGYSRDFEDFSNVIFVGEKNKIEEILNSYKRGGFNLKDNTFNAREKTKKHFGDILDSLNERFNAPERGWAKESIKDDDKVLFIKFNRDEEKNYNPKSLIINYFVKDAKDLTDEDKDFIKSLKRNYDVTNGNETMEYVDKDIPKNGLVKNHVIISNKYRIELFIKSYKSSYQNRFKEVLNARPKTKEHFDDIISSISESVDNGRFYISKLEKAHNEDDEILHDYDVEDRKTKKRYKIIRTAYAWSYPIPEDDIETTVYLYEPELKGKGTHGQMIHSGLTLLTVAHGLPVSKDIKDGLKELKRSRKMYGKPHDSSDDKDLIDLAKFLDGVKQKTLDAYEIKQSMKPETQKHFGDIMIGLNESFEAINDLMSEIKIPEGQEPYILFMNINEASKDSKHYYKIKPLKDLTERDKERLDDMTFYVDNNKIRGTFNEREYTSHYTGAKFYPVLRKHYAFIGGKDNLRIVLDNNILTFGSGRGKFEPELDFKPETEKHFGDIFDNIMDSCLSEKSIHDPVRPGILKRQVKGKMSCSKAKGIKSKQKNKGNNTAKAAQRYLNYHC